MKKPRILTIDDEGSFTEMLKQYFEPREYEINTAGDGDEGLERLKERRYDVVLLDFKMAGLSGEEVIKEINQLYPGTKTIFITAYTNSGKTKTQLLKEGAYAYVEKPISSLKDLEDLVNEAANSEVKEEI